MRKQKKSRAKLHERSPNEGQNKSVDGNVGGSHVPGPATGTHPPRERNERDRTDNVWEAVQAFQDLSRRHEQRVLKIEAAVLVVTILGVIVVGVQACLMHQANSAFRDSLELARESTEISNRAWVLFTRLQFTGEYELEKPYQVILELKNFGQMPATGVRIEHIPGCVETGFQCMGTVAPRLTSNNRAPARAVLSPGGVLTYPSYGPPCQPGMVPQVSGTIVYSDLFKKDRTSNFMVWYDPESGGITSCPVGNESE